MLALMHNTFRERIRGKTFYVVAFIGMVIMLLITTGDSNLTINGKKVTGFEQMVPVALSITGFVSSLLAVMISLRTIPDEFERKTTHLVLIRGIKPWQYMFSLTIGNMLASLFCILSLYVSLFIFCAAYGKIALILPTFLCIIVMSINSMFLSAAVSVVSIKTPVYISGIIGIVVYAAGILHGVLDTMANTAQGAGAILSRIILFFIPNFSAVQQQASNILTGAPMDLEPILGSLMLLYLVLSLAFVLFRKEV
jgi:ABC-type transport system involved in multi-copper enzyme maturation permease subunit